VSYFFGPPCIFLHIIMAAMQICPFFVLCLCCVLCSACFSYLICFNLRFEWNFQIVCLCQKWHEGVKPYVCNECQKCFCTNSALKCHQRVHSNFKGFCCGLCGKDFKRPEAVKRHFKRCSVGDEFKFCLRFWRSYIHWSGLYVTVPVWHCPVFPPTPKMTAVYDSYCERSL